MEKAIIDPYINGDSIKTTSSADADDQSQILVFPSPGQGHMSPMIQFSKSVASKGVRVTLVTTTSSSNSIQAQEISFKVELISDGSEHVDKKSETIDEYLERFRRASFPALFNISRDQFSNLSEAKWLLWNTFDKLEHEVLEWMTSTQSWPIMTVGPTIPSMFFDKRQLMPSLLKMYGKQELGESGRRVGCCHKRRNSLCIGKIMEEEKGMEIRKASLKWKKLTKEAVSEGGSSYKNIDELVAKT
ncbi:hypothetical protein M0R45_001602 [Rubus argutus]|uniref:Uncharacterized protein n=1 Tax=Rubus argutus TaxID=59490 RepID=A0AAW1VGF3_RUBAR